MGCYGIGVGRLAASVCEAHHDDWGPIWPMSIAPWQVHICCLRSDDEETRKVADSLYEDLQNQGLEVIYDDRKVRPGVMFSDADLLGVPVRVIVSPKNLANGECELVTRDKSVNVKVEDKRIPYHNFIYLGDGLTDVPCMQLVKEKGGKSIAIYPFCRLYLNTLD
jgi:prolyl-tRNA synthetase